MFTHVSELFILVPALLGLKGNLDMCLASRLSTQANLGHMSSKSAIIHMVIGNIALVQVQATVAAFIVAVFAISVGSLMNDGEFIWSHAMLLISSSMFTATLSCFVLGKRCVCYSLYYSFFLSVHFSPSERTRKRREWEERKKKKNTNGDYQRNEHACARVCFMFIWVQSWLNTSNDALDMKKKVIEIWYRHSWAISLYTHIEISLIFSSIWLIHLLFCLFFFLLLYSDFVLVAVILLSHRFHMNPDNLATPLAASIGDVVSLSVLSFIASKLFESIGENCYWFYSIFLAITCNKHLSTVQ